MDIKNEEFLLFLQCAEKCTLRYLCIGGYAVNYQGFHCTTDVIDICILPTKENKIAFLNTAKCMRCSDLKISMIASEDFSTYFMCTLGSRPNVIDILIKVHDRLFFVEAGKNKITHRINEETILKIVPYHFLKQMKLLAHRHKNLWDIARLEEVRNSK